VLSAGVSHQQIEDALTVGFAFNTTDRLANAFAFEMLKIVAVLHSHDTAIECARPAIHNRVGN
jgi:hypothetical protein